MPRGGAREGAGRPNGAKRRNCTSGELAEWCRATGAVGLEAQLIAVAHDDALALEPRLEALRRLFGLFASRIVAKRSLGAVQ
jgi:hypothetical protein